MTGVDLKKWIENLNRIGIALSSERNLRKLLELIVEEARGFTNADAGSLYLVDGDRLNYEVIQNDTMNTRLGGTAGKLDLPPVPLSKEYVCAYAAITGEIINIEDVYRVPESMGFNFEGPRRYDQMTGYRTKSMLVVPMVDHEGETIGVLQVINAICPDRHIVIPFAPEYEDLVRSLASQAAVAIRNARLIEEIKNLFEALVEYSATAIDERSPHTAGHSRRVAEMSLRVARTINDCKEGLLADVYFSPEELDELRMAAWLHDLGKIGIPEHILDKAKKLSGLYDGIEIIKERFEAIKKGIENRVLKEKVQLLKRGSESTAELERLDCELAEKIRGVDEDLEFLVRINKPSEPMKDKDLERLNAISKKIYLDNEGQERPYITDREFENLSIRRGSITEEERRQINSHPKRTSNILEKIPFTKNLKNVSLYAASHHEKLNGKGYPNGLTERDLPLQSRILALVDFYDALTASDRPYRQAVSVEKALGILEKDAEDKGIDASILELFVRERLYEDLV